MERESFEDIDVSQKINSAFIAIKVDREERPDIDSIYMSVCQAMTGSGGWPLTIFMTPDKKPFYVGTYFPKYTRFNMIGFMDLLDTLSEKWKASRDSILDVSERITGAMKASENREGHFPDTENEKSAGDITGLSYGDISRFADKLILDSYKALKGNFDPKYGGFGTAPKFPSPHNLIFLMKFYEITKDGKALRMIEKTLAQMYAGGIFDHIGGGFSRYSTDEKWLVPHFEKMLYDNALLAAAYAYAYEITGNELYKSVTDKVFKYVFAELTNPHGGFYCAQDADSEGVEGKYYVFSPEEITDILGEAGASAYCRRFGITAKGNFEGKSIPNLLNPKESMDEKYLEKCLDKLYAYRKNRTKLHLDDKILTSWNSLMIAALSRAYKAFGNESYLNMAKRASEFIEKNLTNGSKLFASYRDGRKSESAFIDDYAFYIWGLIELYESTFEKKYLLRAEELARSCIKNFWDDSNGGFYLYGKDSEQLFLRPKEIYDGAIPSGNSIMAFNLLMLGKILKDKEFEELSNRHMAYMIKRTREYPQGSGFFMYALLSFVNPYKEIVCVLKDAGELNAVKGRLDKNAIVTILERETDEYKLVNGKTTYYVCEHNMCLPPVN